MKSTLVPLAAGAAALSLALVGCGSTSTDDGDAGGAGTVQTRTVTDSTGAEVEVPATPERVVTLHYAATQPVYDLGFTPVGQGAFEPGIVPEELTEEIESVPVVAEGPEPDLEAIAGLTPDLILAGNIHEEELVSQLEAIAPVYVYTHRGGDRARWDLRTEEIADALGVPERADELADAFEARQREIADTYADVIEGTSVGVIGAYEENNFYAWGEDNMSGTLLTPLGFTWSEQENATVADEAEPEAVVSNERLGSVVGDADVLFIDSNLRGEVNAFMADLQSTPLYQELPAVENGRVYAAGKNTVAGYTDADYTLDRVEEALRDMRQE
ncbi:iron-siderophore ABC transporter substrate-binding protein [Nocardiopsis sp. NPDC049922]|uniref:iron-siderophore ABC transporter substrate-binding protein n=1 Tax=Nocardiopsis sp. NPDC049922 TaxID=3155157 RepID=UPI0033E6DF94